MTFVETYTANHVLAARVQLATQPAPETDSHDPVVAV